MYFIVSTGRSGTTTIARTLSLLQDCTCLHEPEPALILESSGYRYGTCPESDLRKTLLETRSARLNGSIYCESNQTLALIIPILADVFPPARFIWLMRNGLDVVASAYQKQWYSGHSENHDRYEDCPPIEKAWIDGRIEGDRCGAMSVEEWKTLDRFSKCCWYWNYVNTLIEHDLKTYAPDKFKLLRLENIETDLTDVVSWMGLDVSVVPLPRKHNVAKQQPYHWSEWTADERQTFTSQCGNLMDRYYPEWRTSTGGWKGVKYYSTSSLFAPLRRNYKFVKWANTLLP